MFHIKKIIAFLLMFSALAPIVPLQQSKHLTVHHEEDSASSNDVLRSFHFSFPGEIYAIFFEAETQVEEESQEQEDPFDLDFLGFSWRKSTNAWLDIFVDKSCQHAGQQPQHLAWLQCVCGERAPPWV